MSTLIRRGLFVLFAAFLAAMATVPAARAQGAGVPVVDLDGKGFGHGVGLSQWGAMYLAQAGQSHDAILSTFYPGTTLTTTSPADVRVAVYNAPDGRATFAFPNGGQVLSSPSGEQAPGFPVDVPPGGRVVVTADGAGYHVSPVVTAQAASAPVAWTGPAAERDGGCIPLLGPCPPPTTGGGGGGGGGGGCGLLGCPTTTAPPTTAPPPTDAPPPSDQPPPDSAPPADNPAPASDPGASSSAPVWAAPASGGVVGVVERGRRYRGLIEATASGGPLRLVNQLGVETYLKGMGEVPGAWPLEAVAAQSVVARTYALRAMSASGEICDYDLCQVYVGADGESAGQSAAVDATTGQILTYGGALATTVYSADAGGISANTLEGFGTDSSRYPYLTTVRYDTPNPLPWHDEIALSDIASRFGYGGTLESVSLGDTGPSGRALTVVLHGSNGDAAVDGRQFAARLGLRSTLFTPTVGTADTAPAAPTEGGAIQVLPDDTAALQAAARTPSKAAATTGARAEQAAPEAAIRPPTAKAVADLAASPVTWVALGILVLVTALAVGRYGIEAPALTVVGGVRLRVPAWALWTRDDARHAIDRARERQGRRRLAREQAALAAVVIPSIDGPAGPAEEVATPASLDAWSPLFPGPRRREPLRAERAAPTPPGPAPAPRRVLRRRPPG